MRASSSSGVAATVDVLRASVAASSVTVKLTRSEPSSMRTTMTAIQWTSSSRAMSARTARRSSALRVSSRRKRAKKEPRRRTKPSSMRRDARGVGAGVSSFRMGAAVVVGAPTVPLLLLAVVAGADGGAVDTAVVVIAAAVVAVVCVVTGGTAMVAVVVAIPAVVVGTVVPGNVVAPLPAVVVAGGTVKPGLVYGGVGGIGVGVGLPDCTWHGATLEPDACAYGAWPT
mmetsp:Transcript_22812/g.70722  ORF Transcript_22812/g.70722 Transcript_22812/m.70722 type:complete len:228 (+) Transcript_22812:711-1394(+)